MYNKKYKINHTDFEQKKQNNWVYNDFVEFITVKTPHWIKDFFSKLDTKVSLLFKSDKNDSGSKKSLSDTINKFANKR